MITGTVETLANAKLYRVKLTVGEGGAEGPALIDLKPLFGDKFAITQVFAVWENSSTLQTLEINLGAFGFWGKAIDLGAGAGTFKTISVLLDQPLVVAKDDVCFLTFDVIEQAQVYITVTKQVS
jgi:hypothetical protein